MLDSRSKVALVLPKQAEIDLFTRCLVSRKFMNVTAFTSGEEAYEVVTRQMFNMFIVRMEMPTMPGVVFVQKIRETGNYGHEAHLFVCEKLEPAIMNVLHELDISNVLAAPFVQNAIIDKIKLVIETENNLSEFEIKYREARAAFFNKLVDMAQDMAEKLLELNPESEKLYVLLGDIAGERNELDAMVVHLKSALKINPKSAVAAYKLAGAYLKRNDSKLAADMFNVLAKLNPYNIRLLENAGLSNLNIKDFEKAESYASSLKKIDVSNKIASEVTVQSKVARGDFDGLAAAMQDSHDNKAIVAFLNNAAVKLAQGDDIKGALRMYESCIRQLEGSKYIHAVYFNMAIAHKKMSNFKEAATCYEKALKIKPDFEKAAASLAELKAKKLA